MNLSLSAGYVGIMLNVLTKVTNTTKFGGTIPLTSADSNY